MLKEKRYRIVAKPTNEAFCTGQRVKAKIVPEWCLNIAVNAIKNDTTIERFFVEEIKRG